MLCYLQELGELQVAEAFGTIMTEMQADELTVPVKGDVVVDRCLAENVTHIFCRNTHEAHRGPLLYLLQITYMCVMSA